VPPEDWTDPAADTPDPANIAYGTPDLDTAVLPLLPGRTHNAELLRNEDAVPVTGRRPP
jgi:hypothetical protein